MGRHRGLVCLAERLAGTAVGHGGEHLVGIYARGAQHVSDHQLVSQGEPGGGAGALSGASHTATPPSTTWAWDSENGANSTAQPAPPPRPTTRCSWALRANGHR